MIETYQQVETKNQDEKGVQLIALLLAATTRLLIVFVQCRHDWLFSVKKVGLEVEIIVVVNGSKVILKLVIHVHAWTKL